MSDNRIIELEEVIELGFEDFRLAAIIRHNKYILENFENHIQNNTTSTRLSGCFMPIFNRLDNYIPTEFCKVVPNAGGAFIYDISSKSIRYEMDEEGGITIVANLSIEEMKSLWKILTRTEFK